MDTFTCSVCDSTYFFPISTEKWKCECCGHINTVYGEDEESESE